MAQEIEKNTIKMRREWRDHPAFDKETYSRMDAWGWIIENALWKDGVVSVDGSPIPLKRGQLSYSIRYLAEKWKWGKSSVHRFMKHLKKWDMADTESGTRQIVITVCNYDKYQLIPNYKRDTSGTQTDTTEGQERDKSGTNKNVGNEGNDSLFGDTPKKPRGAKKKSEGTRLSQDWELSEKNLEHAKSKGMTTARANADAEKFKNHWLSKSGDTAIKVDWDAAWRMWVAKSIEMNPLPKEDRPWSPFNA
jgi:hypothetical protein